jgi:hypothetical protein
VVVALVSFITTSQIAACWLTRPPLVIEDRGGQCRLATTYFATNMPPRIAMFQPVSKENSRASQEVSPIEDRAGSRFLA